MTSTEVQVDTRDGHPVLVKKALDERGRSHLAREARRLQIARHPGVVELLEVIGEPPEELVLAWAGDRTLETARPALPSAVALLASLTATVADLHELGIVHGRITPVHVVVDATGRPTLCGLGGQEPVDLAMTDSALVDDGAPTSADDVAAIGRLIELLVGDVTEAEPIPDRRWGRRRWTGFQRRSLLTLADHATDPEPRRRPSARALARSIGEAVPDARFEPMSSLPAPPDAAERHQALPSTEPEAGSEAVAQDPGGSSEPVRQGTRSTREEVRAPGDDAVPLAPKTFLGMRLVEAYATDWSPEERPTRHDRPDQLGTDVAAGDEPARSRSMAVRTGLVLAAVVALGIVVIGLVDHGRPTIASTSPPTGSVASATPAPASTIEPGASTTTPRTCPATHAPRADVDGDGCLEGLHVAGDVITAGLARFRVGVAGDRVAVGDWDCDGTATPAIVRPATGDVFVFASWASPTGAVTVRPTAQVPGATGPLTAAPSRCGPLVVRQRSGATAEIPTPKRRKP